MEAALNRHRPVYWLHGEETAFPMSLREYVEYCRALDPDGKPYTTDRLTPARVHALVEDELGGAAPRGATLSVLPEFAPIHRGRPDVARVPIYVNHYESGGKHYVNYITCYSYNRPFRVMRFFKIGEHWCDIEHQTLELDADLRPVRMYYAAHGGENGAWVDWDDVEKEGDRPVVYVAKGSHASYSKPGYWFRLYGAANDQTARGFRWDPAVEPVYDADQEGYDPETMGWMRWNRDMGDGHVGALRSKAWWRRPGAQGDTERALHMSSSSGGRFDIFQTTMILMLVWSVALVFLWIYLYFMLRRPSTYASVGQ
jgi:hypothetical protein